MIVSLQPCPEFGICINYGHWKQRYRLPMLRAQLRSLITRDSLCIVSSNWSSNSVKQGPSSLNFGKRMHRRVNSITCRNHHFRCHSFLNSGPSLDADIGKNATLTVARSFNCLRGSPLVIKLASAVAIVIFAVWGLGPLVRLSRNILLHKSDSSWKRSRMYQVTTSYVQPLLLWTGAILICRALDPVVLPTEAAHLVKQRLLNFVRSLSTVLAFAYCLSSVIQQAQKFFMETSDPTDTRNMGFQFAGRAVYTAVWVAAVSLFMELLGFSTQKWLTAGGLGTVLLTLAGREIFTNFLSSAMIHATRPFVVNEWIQTKIEGYEVSGTVEHVGWWSPTIVRGEDREAVHIPNHKFTVNVVRNLSQKTHWRIKTHLAISHLDVSKINNIVADMRKVLAKNPQVEQQKLHRRVFLDSINPENQALMIMVSCFVKTSHFEEYLCVKETIFLDLLRVIRHHRARLATPIRTVQKIYADADLDSIPFSDSIFSRGTVSDRPLLLVEPSYKINGEDKTKSQVRQARANGDDIKVTAKSTPDDKVETKGGASVSTDSKSKETPSTEPKMKEMQTPDVKADAEAGLMPKIERRDDQVSVPKLSNSTKPILNPDIKAVEETKQTKKVGQDTNSVSPESEGRISDNGTQTSSSKQEVRQSVGMSSKSSLEENLVLGVALEGSKRTLPIDEETKPPLSTEEDKDLVPLNQKKELVPLHSGSNPALVEKEKNDDKRLNNPESPSNDPFDQQA